MYQVIARKYRPLSFADLVNQRHVRTTLENAIEQGRIAHGYIFSGQRGTGKTTVARIVARCLNCAQGPTIHPCGECPSCAEITAGSAVDVIEIDAASNRGINEIRELRENVRYRPARGRYKVFIVDEAHQITNEAFNALLKTLEEPPEWVVFILCTTESHKIPATISSRCQQFSFRAVEFDEIVERMQWICEREGIEAGDEVLAVLAQAGEGSVRDSLSALDQAIACCGLKLEAEEVRRLMGLFSLDALHQVTAALAEGNPGRVLEVVDELERSGHNLLHFCRELSRYFRSLLVVKIAGAETRLVAAGPGERARLGEISAAFSREDLTRYLKLSLDLFEQLQASTQPRLHIEMGLLKMVEFGKLAPLEEVLARLEAGAGGGELTRGRARVQASAPVEPLVARPRSGPAKSKAEPSGPTAPPPAVPSAAEEDEPPLDEIGPGIGAGKGWPARLASALRDLGMTFTADAAQHSAIEEADGSFLFRTPREFSLSMKEADVRKGFSHLGVNPRKIRIELTSAATPPGAAAEPNPAASEELLGRAMEDPDVRRFQELFDGQVRDVTNLRY
jgi:DNA polymerase III subunit gamma/tau